MKLAPIKGLLEAGAAALEPPVEVALSEWSEQNVRLSSEGSAAVGNLVLFPYQGEPLNCMSPHGDYEQVCLMWASQMSKTQLSLCLLSYVIAETAGPCLYVMPTLSMAETFSKDRLAPAIRDTPILRACVADPKSRDSGNTILHRRFTGGSVSIVGSNSPAGLASRAIRYLWLDEVDRFEASAGSEGSPTDLAIARTRTYWNRRIVWTSSPTIADASVIEAVYKASDMREWFIPCPLCGRFQTLLWRRVEWPEGRPGDAHLRCCGCEKLIPHHMKASMESGGEWRAQNPGPNRIAGFHLSELHSPFRSWGELAEDWIKAQGNPEKLRAFFNTSLAECWNDEGQGTVGESELLKRREAYLGVPEQVAILLAGVDVQDDRVEVSVYGYGRGEESWLLAHRIIPGDPSTPALWSALDGYLLTTWPHPILGPVQIHATAIDSGGHYTNAACSFAEARRGRRVWAIKGATGARPIWPRKQSKAPKGRVYLIGVDSARSTIAQRLRIAEAGPGFMHFPAMADANFFSQLTSEFQQTTYRRGRPERQWVRRAGRAAETWDCANYAYAALCGLRSHGIDVDAEAERIEAMKGAAGPERGPGYRVYRSRFVSG